MKAGYDARVRARGELRHEAHAEHGECPGDPHNLAPAARAADDLAGARRDERRAERERQHPVAACQRRARDRPPRWEGTHLTPAPVADEPSAW